MLWVRHDDCIDQHTHGSPAYLQCTQACNDVAVSQSVVLAQIQAAAEQASWDTYSDEFQDIMDGYLGDLQNCCRYTDFDPK